MRKHVSSQGQTIIEVVIALAVGILLLTGITVAVTTSLNNAHYSKEQNQASQLAQEGIDAMRSIRDSSYTTFIGYSPSTQYCLNDGQTVPEISCSQIDQTFTRTVAFSDNDPSCAIDATTYRKVTVAVTWSDGRCSDGALCHNVTLASCFSDYLVVPTPQ